MRTRVGARFSGAGGGSGDGSSSSGAVVEVVLVGMGAATGSSMGAVVVGVEVVVVGGGGVAAALSTPWPGKITAAVASITMAPPRSNDHVKTRLNTLRVGVMSHVSY
jgi:flagellar motor component MotA